MQNSNLNIKNKFFTASIKNLNKFNSSISKENMIFIKPNFKLLKINEKLNPKNYDLAFYFDLNKSKRVRHINSKQFVSSKFPYLVLVRDRGKNDNIILILQTPKLRKQTGGNLISPPGVSMPQFNPIKEAGPGFSHETFTNNGWKIGDYKPPVVDINKLPEDLQNHDQNLYPSDPTFGSNGMVELVNKEKEGYKNFEKGFAKGFDNGYHKGYYFGYSSAAAYLYRFYKKYYTDYMNKYEDKIKYEADKSLDKKKDELIQKITNPLAAVTNMFGGEDSGKMYQGLPLHMLPENVMSLEALQPQPTGIFYYIDMLLSNEPPESDPHRHCYKPTEDQLNESLRKNIHPHFRDAVIGIEENWDDRVFNRSCNKFSLKFMDYCTNDKHPGVEFDGNVGKYHKTCKKMEDTHKSRCSIM